MKQKTFPKKLVIFAIIAIITAGLISAFSWLFFAPPLANSPLSPPTNLKVIELSNGQKEIYVDPCETKGTTYTFVIIPENQNRIIATTLSNKFSATALLDEPITYSIYCRYTAKNKGNSSDFINITYTTKTTLSAPSIHLGTGTNSSRLYFASNNLFKTEVKLAFELIYINGTQTQTFSTYYQTTNNNKGVVTGYFDLSTAIPQNGTYSLSIRVKCTNNPNILPSTLSQQIVFTA